MGNDVEKTVMATGWNIGHYLGSSTFTSAVLRPGYQLAVRCENRNCNYFYRPSSMTIARLTALSMEGNNLMQCRGLRDFYSCQILAL